MSVSKKAMYSPDDAIHELTIQKRVLETAIDTQVVLRILVDKGICTREEVAKYRDEVRSSDKYRLPMEDIDRQICGYGSAKDNPEQFLKSIFKAKLDGRL